MTLKCGEDFSVVHGGAAEQEQARRETEHRERISGLASLLA